jgi:hypothetical protein
LTGPRLDGVSLSGPEILVRYSFPTSIKKKEKGREYSRCVFRGLRDRQTRRRMCLYVASVAVCVCFICKIGTVAPSLPSRLSDSGSRRHGQRPA